jgi:hypothetical protein
MKKLRITQSDYVKAHRKASREAEIENHKRPLTVKRVHKSKKAYDRKRLRADDKKGLPLLFSIEVLRWSFTSKLSEITQSCAA